MSVAIKNIPKFLKNTPKAKKNPKINTSAYITITSVFPTRF